MTLLLRLFILLLITIIIQSITKSTHTHTHTNKKERTMCTLLLLFLELLLRFREHQQIIDLPFPFRFEISNDPHCLTCARTCSYAMLFRRKTTSSSHPHGSTTVLCTVYCTVLYCRSSTSLPLEKAAHPTSIQHQVPFDPYQ